MKKTAKKSVKRATSKKATTSKKSVSSKKSTSTKGTMPQNKELDFASAFKYPFNRPVALLYALWILLPIFGWFALGGYTVRVIQENSKGKFKELPKMQFGSDMKKGFLMFLKAIPFMLLAMVVIGMSYIAGEAIGSLVELFIGIFIIPILAINFINKETVESFFEFDIVKSVFENFGDYIITIIKTLFLSVIFFVMIIVLVGIPASIFGRNIFLADFYRRHVK